MGEFGSEMFPVFAIILLIGSVILMFLWEFHHKIRTKVFPIIIDLLSVADEKHIKAPIYLGDPNYESEYSFLIQSAERFVWLGFPRLTESKFRTLLDTTGNSIILRAIVANKTNSDLLQQMSQPLNRAVEVIHRPRIHFKIIVTEERVSVGSADISSKESRNTHELGLIASDPSLVNEVQQYIAAFYEGSAEYPTDNQLYSISSELPQKTKTVFVNTSNGLNTLLEGLLASTKESIILVSPAISMAVAEYILRTIPRDIQVKVITSVSWQHWLNDLADPEAIELFLSDRVVIDACPNLHANCIIVDGEAALISSQNLTTDSLFSKDEAGIYTKNPKLIKDLLDRIVSWKPKHRFTMKMLEQEIAKLDSYQAKEPPATVPILDQPAEEVALFSAVETLTPPLLGFSTITRTMKGAPHLTAQVAPSLESTAKAEKDWIEDIVYVGKKRTVEYVRACQHQIKRKGSVTIRARGKLIYRAVDVAEQLRMLEELELILNEDSIKIETYYPTGKETKWGGISQIAITLYQKN